MHLTFVLLSLLATLKPTKSAPGSQGQRTQKRERGRQRGVKRERQRGRERETVSVGWCCKTCIFAVGNALKYAAHFMRHDVNWAQGTMEGVQRIRGAAARCVGPRGVEFPTQVS